MLFLAKLTSEQFGSCYPSVRLEIENTAVVRKEMLYMVLIFVGLYVGLCVLDLDVCINDVSDPW